MRWALTIVSYYRSMYVVPAGPRLLRIFLLAGVLGGLAVQTSWAVPLQKISHLFDIRHDFSHPSDVAVAENGLIYVVDGVNSQVKVFDQDGGFAFAFGRQGTGQGAFDHPLGIDVAGSGTVYIADSGNHRVQVFTPDGKFLSQVAIPTVPGDRPADPTDVAVDEARNCLYVVDNDNHRLALFALDTLRYKEVYGAPGSAKREFRYPFLMDIDPAGFLYVADVVNTRVQVLNADGLFVAFLGGWGVEPGEFFRPKGVAVDHDGLIYVSDSFMGVIQVFKTNGWFHSVLADAQTGQVKKFQTPVGLCIDKNNRLYVVEMLANRVGVYAVQSGLEAQ